MFICQLTIVLLLLVIFLHTLGELEGFIDTQYCDVTIVVGDFNVDFDRDGPLATS